MKESNKKSSAHDMNGQNAALMTGEEIIDKVANDGVGLVPEPRHNPADKRPAARMPLQIDRARNIPGAVYFRPTVRTSGLFGPNLNEPKFPLQLRIIHNFVTQ